jgi:hypothetical protein
MLVALILFFLFVYWKTEFNGFLLFASILVIACGLLLYQDGIQFQSGVKKTAIDGNFFDANTLIEEFQYSSFNATNNINVFIFAVVFLFGGFIGIIKSIADLIG